jgi:hypothetical protein
LRLNIQKIKGALRNGAKLHSFICVINKHVGSYKKMRNAGA